MITRTLTIQGTVLLCTLTQEATTIIAKHPILMIIRMNGYAIPFQNPTMVYRIAGNFRMVQNFVVFADRSAATKEPLNVVPCMLASTCMP